LFTYLLIVNLAGLLLMWFDKARARAGTGRAPENKLLLLALAGGATGVFLGMWLFRHKTRHLKFTLGVPLIIVAQTVLIGLFREVGILRQHFAG